MSDHGLGATEVSACLQAALADAGEFDLGRVLDADAVRKLTTADRSR
jgi:hypothetical protein